MSNEEEVIHYPELAYINPKELNEMLKISGLEKEMQKAILGKNSTPLVLDGDWDIALPHKFVETDVYRSLSDHFIDGKPWIETDLFVRVVKDMKAGNTKWGCKTPEKYLQRLENDVDTLFESINNEGFLTQVQMDTEKHSDEIRVIIDRYGKMIFLDGRHRLAISKILGIEKIPVKIILRHADWVQFQHFILQYAKRNGNKIYR